MPRVFKPDSSSEDDINAFDLTFFLLRPCSSCGFLDYISKTGQLHIMYMYDYVHYNR